MTQTQDLATLTAENENFKILLEQFQAQKNALEETLRELLSANINLKANLGLVSKKLDTLTSENASLSTQIAESKKNDAVSDVNEEAA